jgi:hypothetical protein
MDNKQAKFILESYRPGDRDASDPQFNEALNWAARDSELTAWFAEERACDAAISRKLKELPVPASLRDDLLVHRPLPSPRRAPRSYAALGLAAALIFLAVAAALWFRPIQGTTRFANFRNDMLASVSTVVSLDFVHENMGEIRKWLATQASFTDYQIPAALQRLPGRGCRTFAWNGQPVALICFRLEGNRTVHLFVASRAAIPDPPSGESAQWMQRGKWATASWTQGDKVYVMASVGDEASLQQYL